MRKLLVFGLALTMLYSCSKEQKKSSYSWPSVKAPVAMKKPHWRVMFGDSVLDNYYWMYDYFGKGPDSTKAVDYLVAENAYTDTMMSGTKDLQKKLFSEMKSRIKENDQSVPVFKNGYYYYTKTEKGKQYFEYCRKKGSLNAPEEVLLNVNKMAEGHPYYMVTGITVSQNNNLLAYAVDAVSRRQYTIYVKNLKTGKILSDAIERTSGDPCWANDNKTLFYTSNNPLTLLSEKINRHVLGTDQSKDVTVYNETDKSNYIGVDRSKNGKYIFIHSAATLSSETYYINANKPDAKFKSFQPRMKDVLYTVIPLADRFLILTNKDAENFKIMECPLNQTAYKYWKDYIPERDSVLIDDVDAFKNYLVIAERKNGLEKLRVRKLSDNSDYYINFKEPAYSASLASNPEYATDTLRYTYSSLITPATVYDYNMSSKTQKQVKQQEVLGGYNPEDYAEERVYATAKDGTKIPVSIVYKKGLKKDGSAPLLLYAYGSYGFSMEDSFSSTRLSLLNRGFVYAIAHIRGGSEMGRQWYLDGKMFHKINTFTDFIAAGNYLVSQHYTSPEHLYANGGSAGGLLMGAVVNMAPQLWHGVVAQVPFVDVVNTMLDESIPLTTNEFDEWGNPKNKDSYFYMKSYAPYENVEKKAYPNLLVTTGLHDSQVQYFEPSKWVAKLRANKTDNNVLLLHCNMNYGHGGASGRFDYLKDLAFNYSFIFALEGINQ